MAANRTLRSRKRHRKERRSANFAERLKKLHTSLIKLLQKFFNRAEGTLRSHNFRSMETLRKQLHNVAFSKKQRAAAVILIASSLIISGLSMEYLNFESEVAKNTSETPSENSTDDETHIQFGGVRSSLANLGDTDDNSFKPKEDVLNLAYFYPDGADQSDTINSYAGQVYKELMTEDNEYIAGIYDEAGITPYSMAKKLGLNTNNVLGKYNPTAQGQNKDDPSTWFIPNFKNVNFSFYNADGQQVNEYSNVKDIMAMASVYCYEHNYEDVDTFTAICRELYQKSRSYTVSIGNVYYDDGCIHQSAEEEAKDAERIDSALNALTESLRAITSKTEGLLSTTAAETGAIDLSPDITSSISSDTSLADTTAETKNYETQTDAYGNSAGKGIIFHTTQASESATVNDSSSGTSDTEVSSAKPETTGMLPSTGSTTDVSPSAAAEASKELTETENNSQILADYPEGNASYAKGMKASLLSEQILDLSQNGGNTVPETAAASTEAFTTAQDASGLDAMTNTSDTSDTEESTKKYWNYEAGHGIDEVNASMDAKKASMDASSLEEAASASSEQSSDGNTVLSEASTEASITLGTFTSDQLATMDQASLKKLLESSLAQEQDKKTSSDVDDVNAKNYCPGHVDLYVRVTIYGFEDDKGLRSINLDATRELDAIDEEDPHASNWHGWTPKEIGNVKKLISQDWFQKYGLSISTINTKKPLTEEEISGYMVRLPDDLSENRKKVVKYALESVGKIPYYWGGKAAYAGYDKNGFGTVVSPDYKGRVLRGLDCSGWVNWVYRSAIGNNLGGAEGTITLIAAGVRINRADLQPGDIIIRPGADSHVVMFLEWSENGNMIAIHENGTANNVSVNEVTANYPYYRSLIT